MDSCKDLQMDCAETSDYFDTTTQDSVKIEKSLDPSDYTINLNLQPFNGKSPKEEIPNQENVVCVKEEKIALTKDTIGNATNLFFQQADKRKIYMPKHPLPKAKLILIKRDLLSEKYRYFNVCGECGKPFKSLTYMNRNLLHCDKCGNWISKRSPVSCHTNIPDVRSRFECKDCGKCFAQKSEFISHNSESGKPNLFKCEKCGKRFSEKFDFHLHRLVHVGQMPYICRDCGEGFACRSDLINHTLIRKTPHVYRCEMCGKCYKDKYDLNFHRRNHILRPHRCKDCGLRNNSAPKSSHTRSNKETPHFKCEECGERLRHKSEFRAHILFHRKQRLFKCEECGKRFPQKSALRAHILRHISKQSYTCEDCGDCQSNHNDMEQTHNTTTIQHDFAITDSAAAI
ncbi:unnamed protein product, partial [Timema podura]|nr:unnamed protein product [Timema podura]